MKHELKHDYRLRLSALGFSRMEIDAIELVMIRMGVLVPSESDFPKFLTCYSLDDDASVNEQRWRQGMTETGFSPAAIRLAEHGLGLCAPDCELCPSKGTA